MAPNSKEKFHFVDQKIMKISQLDFIVEKYPKLDFCINFGQNYSQPNKTHLFLILTHTHSKKNAQPSPLKIRRDPTTTSTNPTSTTEIRPSPTIIFNHHHLQPLKNSTTTINVKKKVSYLCFFHGFSCVGWYNTR